ncbi:MAG: cupin domain-containing protein [Gallionella sp.]
MRKQTLLALFAILIAIPLAIAATEAAFKRTVLQKIEFPGDVYATVLVQVDVNPDGLIARHTHPGIEMTYVVKGEGDLLVEGQPSRHLKAGDSFKIPPGVPHSLQNGPEPLVLAANFVVEKDKPLSSPAP